MQGVDLKAEWAVTGADLFSLRVLYLFSDGASRIWRVVVSQLETGMLGNCGLISAVHVGRQRA